MYEDAWDNWSLSTYQNYSIQVGDICLDYLLFERFAACLGNVQCPKRIVDDYDVLVSIISNFEKRQTSQFTRLYWNVVIFEKLILWLFLLTSNFLLHFCYGFL